MEMVMRIDRAETTPAGTGRIRSEPGGRELVGRGRRGHERCADIRRCRGPTFGQCRLNWGVSDKESLGKRESGRAGNLPSLLDSIVRLCMSRRTWLTQSVWPRMQYVCFSPPLGNVHTRKPSVDVTNGRRHSHTDKILTPDITINGTRYQHIPLEFDTNHAARVVNGRQRLTGAPIP